MRIGIDYTAAIAQRAGIGRYTRSLVAALLDQLADEIDERDTLTLYSSEAPSLGYPFPTGPRVRARTAGVGERAVGNRVMTILWHRLGIPLPLQMFTGPLDVLHAPDFALPPSIGARTLVTIHDLAFLTHPECALPSLVAYLGRVVPRAVRRAAGVVAVSERTAIDLVELLGIPREKIAVIPLGVDAMFAPVTDATRLAAVERRYGLAHPLVLSVGTLEPRKNYARLIDAFAQASRVPGGPAMLALAGGEGWLTEGIYAAVEECGVADRVRFLGYVPDADLPALYSLAEVVAVPSLYEGFGIPVIEAMACGRAVLASTGGSLPEVAGEAALLVPPTETEALADGLARLCRDADLRAAFGARGRARARGYTWAACAEAHLALYRALGAGLPAATSGVAGRSGPDSSPLREVGEVGNV